MVGEVEALYSAVFGGLFVCWLLPLGMLCGVVLVGSAVRSAWRTRGLEQDGLYCSRCRFDLRGCASWNCPECGGHLDDGRVLTPGYDPPMGLTARMLLMTVLSAGPLVLLGVVGATIWSGSYVVDRSLILTPEVHGRYAQIEIDGRGESVWFHRGRPDEIRLNNRRVDYSMTPKVRVRERYVTPLPESDTDLLPDGLWGQVEALGQFQDEPTAWRDGSRAELVAWLRYAAAEGDRPDPGVRYFQVKEQSYQYFEPGPLTIIVLICLGLLGWFLVMRWVLRWHDRSHAAHVRAFAAVNQRLTAGIERNRAAAGLGKKVNRES